MPGRRVFLRRRHVAAGASRANPKLAHGHGLPGLSALATRQFVAPRSVPTCGGRRCCRAASGARAAGGPARRIGLPSVTWRPLITGKVPGGDSAGTDRRATGSLVTFRSRAPGLPATEGSIRYPPSLRRRQTSDNVSPPQRKPFGGYVVDTPKRAGDNGGYLRRYTKSQVTLRDKSPL